MADFKTRIDDLTGFGSTDDVAIADWLIAGAREIIDILPMSKLDRMSEIQEFTNFQGVEDSKILHVLRKDENNSNVLMPCREIHASQSGRASDSNYMEFATSSDPVYYLENKRIYTLPASASSDDSKLVKINEDFTIAATDSTIDNFPKEATNAVVLYASRNALIRLMNNMNTISALTVSVSAPSAPTLATVSYSAAANADATSTGVATISVGSVTDIDPTGSVPTYTKPTTTVNFGSGNNFDTLLGTDEDSELASVEIQKQRELLSQYQTDIQNELNEFNKDNVRYQAEMQDELAKHNTALQRALTQAQIDAQEAQQEAQQATSVDLANKAQDQVLALQNEAQTMAAAIQNNDDLISKFNSELSKYSAQVNDEIQEYNTNLQKDVAKYSWYEKQYAMLSAQFQEALQLISVDKIQIEEKRNNT
jgi:hypothetical protein